VGQGLPGNVRTSFPRNIDGRADERNLPAYIGVNLRLFVA
jgi:hypothetical protein